VILKSARSKNQFSHAVQLHIETLGLHLRSAHNEDGMALDHIVCRYKQVTLLNDLFGKVGHLLLVKYLLYVHDCKLLGLVQNCCNLLYEIG